MLALALTLSLHAAPFEDYDRVQFQGNTAGLAVLGAWSVASTVTGVVGLATTTDPQWKGAHVANLIWGIVNMGFAAFGLYTGLRPSARHETYADSLADGRSTQNIYAINAALDVGYMALSALLWMNVHDERFVGFAQGSLIQALWLLGFDSTMALFHQLNNARAQ